MQVLIDTNILIHREDPKVLSPELADLLRLLNDHSVGILIHPLSKTELERDQNTERRIASLSKASAYPQLKSPPIPDSEFMARAAVRENHNDQIDANLLFCLERDAVDFLITEDAGLRKRAVKLTLEDRVFSIKEAYLFFTKQFKEPELPEPPAIDLVPTHNLSLEDPIFAILLDDYPEFKQWWRKICLEGREAWIHRKPDGKLGALLIYKEENERAEPLPAGKRLKISTFIVTLQGYRIGELFIKIAVEYAVKAALPEIYLTHFTGENDQLVALIEQYGFQNAGQNSRGEAVFLKKLLVPVPKPTKTPLEIARQFYPSFVAAENIEKFLVPIQPPFHTKLFTNFKTNREEQLQLSFPQELVIEGNTIRKAYLSNSQTKKVSKGALVLFYRSKDEKAITSIGVVEEVFRSLLKSEDVIRKVGNRSVYTGMEIDKLTSSSPVQAIIFRWHFHFPEPITLITLRKRKILNNAPQSISRISHKQFNEIIELGQLDRRYVID